MSSNIIEFDATKSKESQFKEDLCLRQSNGIAKEEEDDNEKNISCGWRGFRPNCLQRFRAQRWVLFWLCWASALQGFIVNGCVSVVITTIEKRYKLKSTESGLIASGYDVGAFLFLAPISYFGGTRSKPLFLGVGVFIMGIGSLVFSSPYFTAGRYEFSEEVEDICRNNLNETLQFCSDTLGEGLSNYKWIFFLGNFLLGVGGCAYLDENLPTKQSSLYLGIYYSMSVLGPGLGYLLGGQLLKWLYVDWLYVNPDDIGLNSSSPVWVGGWYVVFIIGFILAIIIFLPVSAFPKELPDKKKIQAEKVSETHSKHQDSEAVVNKEFGQTAKDLPKSLRILVTNPTFIFLNLVGASEGMVVSALATFLPKIVEQQFSISTSSAALIVGLVTIAGASGGTFIGGYIVKRYNLKCAAIIKFCICCSIVSIGIMMTFLVSCPNINFAGVTNSYPNENTVNLSINSKCNANCSCSVYKYDPVCGINNQVFYSACHAGCQDVHQFGDSKAYSNCECLKVFDNSSLINDPLNPSKVSIHFEAFRNKCESDCKFLPFFLVLVFLGILLTFLVSIPALNATLRCVAESQKSFALGIQWMSIRLLGTIPAPLLCGFLIDLSCILWQKTCDDESGACLMYDNKKVMRNILFLCVSIKVLSTIFFFFAWFLYKSPQPTESSIIINSKIQELNTNLNLNSISQIID